MDDYEILKEEFDEYKAAHGKDSHKDSEKTISELKNQVANSQLVFKQLKDIILIEQRKRGKVLFYSSFY